MLNNFVRVKIICRFDSPQQNRGSSGKPVQSPVQKSGEIHKALTNDSGTIV